MDEGECIVMNIVILRLNVGDFGKVGSYNVQEVGLANALIQKGHQVNVLYLNRKTSSIEQDETYEFVYYLPHVSFGLHGIFDTKLLASFKPDRVILFSDNQLWAKNVIKWCRGNYIVCIQYLGNVLSDNKKWLHQFYTKLILMRNRKSYRYSINVAKTKKAQKEMESLNVPFSRVIKIGLDETLLQVCINPDYKIRKSFGFEDDEKVLLYVGRIVDYKKPFLACDILQTLIGRGINCRMVIIGTGVLESDLREHIIEKKLTNKIQYIERVPYSEMYKYMVACDCFINLSSIEIFGMAILEAMYYGLPVVAHVAPGPSDVITDSQTGFLCETDNPNVWGDLVLKAIENRKEISLASRNTIINYYMWDKIADEFLEL